MFVNVAEPIESGFVQTLARPGGHITGFTNFEASIGGKWLQLLKEADPRIVRIAIIYNPQTAPFAALFLRSVQSAALLCANCHCMVHSARPWLSIEQLRHLLNSALSVRGVLGL